MAGGGGSGDLLQGHMHLTSVGDMMDNVGVMDGDQLFSSLTVSDDRLPLLVVTATEAPWTGLAQCKMSPAGRQAS